MADSRGGHHDVRANALTALQGCLEPAIGLGQGVDELLADVDSLDPAEPVGVVQEDADRNGIDLIRPDAVLFQIGLQRVDRGPVEVPVRPRPQEHALGHILPPKAHRPAQHHSADTTLTRQRRDR